MNNRNSEKTGEIVEYMLKYMFTVYLKLFSCKLFYKFQLRIKYLLFHFKAAYNSLTLFSFNLHVTSWYPPQPSPY